MDGVDTKAHVAHQDQVTKVPPNAHVTASAPYCPVAALAYDFPAMSVQFHPEYTPDYLGDFLTRSRGDILTTSETDAALTQITQATVAPDLYAQKAADFFRAHAS